MRHWANAIRIGTAVVARPDQAVVVSEMLKALSTSTNTGKSIDFQRALCTHLFTSIRRQ